MFHDIGRSMSGLQLILYSGQICGFFIDGKDYKVRTPIKEQRGKGKNAAYMYSLEGMDLSDGHNEAVESEPTRKSDRSIPLANVLDNIEKAYNPGKKILDESEKSAEGEEYAGVVRDEGEGNLSEDADRYSRRARSWFATRWACC